MHTIRQFIQVKDIERPVTHCGEQALQRQRMKYSQSIII